MILRLICLVCILGYGIASAQTVTVQKITDQKIAYLLNHIRLFKSFSAKDLGISVFVVTNPDGTAPLAEGHESTATIYFGVIEPDLNPRQSLYCIKDLYAISDIELEKNMVGEAWIRFSYVDIKTKKNTKKKITTRLTLEKATIMR